MLSTLHNRAYQDFLTLLTDFHNFMLNSQKQTNLLIIKQEFKKLEQWFKQNINSLDDEGIDTAYIPRWQSVQREVNREFKLLTTDILFLASARQDATRIKRLKSISDRLSKLSSYCRGMLEESSNKE
ncbi:MAG: heterocyst frequency control protein PatD [Pleurocapsa sp.]